MKTFVKSKSRTRFVYLIQCEDYVKVGVSSNPEGRLRSMQTGNPFNMFLVNKWETTSDFRIESITHRELAEYRVHGEWFKCSPLVASNKIGNALYGSILLEMGI